MNPLSEEYARWLRAQLVSPQVIIRRQQFLRRVVEEIGDPATITGDEIGGWLTPWTGWTLSSYFAAVKSVMNFMHDTGRRLDHPMLGMRAPKIPKPRPMPFTDDEVSLILGSTRGDHRVQLELALYLGLRSHEIAKIVGQDVRQYRTFVLGKGGKEALLPTHPRVWEIAQEYPRAGYWFPSRSKVGHVRSDWITTKTSRLFVSLGFEGSIHRLRATYGTRLLRQGADITEVQILMRHETLASTQHYLGVDEDRLSAAIGRLSFGERAA